MEQWNEYLNCDTNFVTSHQSEWPKLHMYTIKLSVYKTIT